MEASGLAATAAGVLAAGVTGAASAVGTASATAVTELVRAREVLRGERIGAVRRQIQGVEAPRVAERHRGRT
ncbi:hypothetical protein [Streptomyces sp. NPDC093094]|uniref:hypothetical protein n=1 Tax=Streptomyces sp. NPDC093094 TaxID=3366026 RepID=UPI0037FAAD75